MRRTGEETQFQRRVKEAISASKYSRISLCNELHITKNAFDRYMKTGAHLPNLDIIRNIARLLDVDVGYLLGDYDYPKIAPLNASKLLGLSEDACEVIKKDLVAYSYSKETFEKLITNPNFPTLLAKTYSYTHSYSHESLDRDKAGIFEDEISPNNSKEKCLNQFTEILDEMYKKEVPTVKALLVEKIVTDLINYVFDFCKTYGHMDNKIRELLKKHISSVQNEIKQHAPKNYVANLSTDYIIENIYKLYGIISYSEDFPVEYVKMVSTEEK